MRKAVVLVVVSLLGAVGLAAGLEAEKDGARFGVALDLETYPQGKPQETLTSLLRAVELNRLDYVVAQLSDPAFIDYRVKTFGGRIVDQVDDTRARLDPGTVKLLRRFLKDGEWQVADKEAMTLLKDMKDRFLFFQKIGNRWYLLHRSKPARAEKPEKPVKPETPAK